MAMKPEFPSLARFLEQTLAPHERERVGLISFNHWRFALGAVAGLELYKQRQQEQEAAAAAAPAPQA